MHKLSSEDRRLYEEVLGRMRGLVAETRNRLKPKLVILYGSFVRGDWHRGSDLDLLVVSDNVSPNFMDRWDPLYAVIMGFPTEPHVYTTQEFEEMLTHGRMTALDALTEGVILHANKRFMKKVEKMLKETMEKLEPQKIGVGWKLKNLSNQ